MGQLQDRMIEDLTLRGSAPNTHLAYVRCARAFVAFHRRPPAELGRSTSAPGSSTCSRCASGARARSTSHRRPACALRRHAPAPRGHGRRARCPHEGSPARRPQRAAGRARCSTHAPSPKHRAMFMLLYGAGLRVSEVLALTTADVDSARMVLHMRDTKNRHDRIVPLPRPALDALRAYWKLRAAQGPMLFEGRCGRVRRSPAGPSIRRSRAPLARPGSFIGSIRTCCATPSPRTCWSSGATCAPCRSCSGIGRCRAPRATRTSRRRDARRSAARWRRSTPRQGSASGSGPWPTAMRASHPRGSHRRGCRWETSCAPTATRCGRRLPCAASSTMSSVRSRAAAPPRSADTSRCATPAATARRSTTRAATVTARRARTSTSTSGWKRVARGSSRPATCTWSSRCPRCCAPSCAPTPEALYAMLFEAASQTLLTLAKDPRRLGALPSITMVLHTWTRELLFHPHLHAVVSAGGLSPDGARWITKKGAYLFPVKVMAKLFRGKFRALLLAALTKATVTLPEACGPNVLDDLRGRSARDEVGGVRKGALRRRRAGVRVPRALHPSRGDLQRPAAHRRRAGRDLRDEEGPRAHAARRGVSAALHGARAAQGFHADPALRSARASHATTTLERARDLGRAAAR
jgi:hypothetical protein